jgi:hypothetical protein
MQNFINKLDKIEFNGYNDCKLTSSEGWAVSYSVQLQDTHGLVDSMFQVVVRLSYNGTFVQSYGCTTAEETNQFGKWFLAKKSNARDLEFKQYRRNEDIGKAIFSNL